MVTFLPELASGEPVFVGQDVQHFPFRQTHSKQLNGNVKVVTVTDNRSTADLQSSSSFSGTLLGLDSHPQLEVCSSKTSLEVQREYFPFQVLILAVRNLLVVRE